MNSMPDDNSESGAHWRTVYTTREADRVSWFRPHLDRSLTLLESAGLSMESRVIDVGAGASSLVDDLLDRDVAAVHLVDIAGPALDLVRARLAQRADQRQRRVSYELADVSTLRGPDSGVSHWHDRAVLHFLHAESAVSGYLAGMRRLLSPGGHALIAGFAPDGPERCSGLPVARRSSAELQALLGTEFELLGEERELHRTPAGGEQAFLYTLFRRRD